ncbi:hypothetical protein CLOP_g10753 [Closterium sp. NIES-67]|nr:hypothetical protein CLOP_g10753 [Closterium sp. NIES-67]
MRRLGGYFGRHDATPNAATCSARLCDALHQWAQLARERELRTTDDLPKDDPLKDDSLKGDPLPEEEVARQQAAGVGQVCTGAWRSGVMARAGRSKFVRRLVAEGETSLANISAGIDPRARHASTWKRRCWTGAAVPR